MDYTLLLPELSLPWLEPVTTGLFPLVLRINIYAVSSACLIATFPDPYGLSFAVIFLVALISPP